MNKIKKLNAITSTDKHKGFIRSKFIEIYKKNWTVKIKPEFESKLFLGYLVELDKIYLV